MCYSLRSLLKFSIETNDGLLKQVEEGDYEGLVSVMGHLSNVQERQDQYDSMFEPLTFTLHLLQTYDVEIPDDVYTLMQVRLLLVVLFIIIILGNYFSDLFIPEVHVFCFLRSYQENGIRPRKTRQKLNRM